MIVSSYFDDDHCRLGWAQHDVYGEALWIFAEGWRKHVASACDILGINPAIRVPEPQSIDHRTVQMAHDILAATWRFRFDPSQQDWLDTRTVGISEWLGWLRAEIATWNNHPAIVRAAMTITQHQNVAKGYRAETELHSLLITKFSDVPWRGDLLRAIASDLERE